MDGAASSTLRWDLNIRKFGCGCKCLDKGLGLESPHHDIGRVFTRHLSHAWLVHTFFKFKGRKKRVIPRFQ
jgi:hypothetical protein